MHISSQLSCLRASIHYRYDDCLPPSPSKLLCGRTPPSYTYRFAGLRLACSSSSSIRGDRSGSTGLAGMCPHVQPGCRTRRARHHLRRKGALHLVTSTGRVSQSTERLHVPITTPASSSSMQQHEATVAQTWIFVCRRTLVTCQWRPRCPRGGPQVGCTVLMIAVLACDSRAVYMSHRATWKGGELRTRVCDLCAVHTTGPP